MKTVPQSNLRIASPSLVLQSVAACADALALNSCDLLSKLLGPPVALAKNQIPFILVSHTPSLPAMAVHLKDTTSTGPRSTLLADKTAAGDQKSVSYI